MTDGKVYYIRIHRPPGEVVACGKLVFDDAAVGNGAMVTMRQALSERGYEMYCDAAPVFDAAELEAARLALRS